MLPHSRVRVSNALHQAQAGQARGFADDGDFAGALAQSQAVENGIEILDDARGRTRLQLLNELLLARRTAVPRVRRCRIGVPGRGLRCRCAKAFGTHQRVDRAAGGGGPGKGVSELFARANLVHAGQLGGLLARHEHAPFRELQPFIPRLQEQRRLAGPAVEQHEGARHFDASQVEELVVLAEPDVGGVFRGSLQDGDAVANRREHPGPTSGELVRRKSVGE